MKTNARSAGVVAKTSLEDLAKPDSQELLRAMQAVQGGDFSVRLPHHWTGLSGKIADTFNAIVASNQRMAAELQRVGHVVGRQGKVRQRLDAGSAGGAWRDMETS